MTRSRITHHSAAAACSRTIPIWGRATLHRIVPPWRLGALWRLGWLACFCLLPLGVLSAQAPNDKDQLPEPENRTLAAKDGTPIHITYYPFKGGRETPVIILLHMKGGNRFVWQKGLAERLQAAGYAVITADLRGHGESKMGSTNLPGGNANQDLDKKKKPSEKRSGSSAKKVESADLKPADFQAMVGFDMEAIKRFIFEEHQAEHLNMNKIGIVGPELGASVAVRFTWNDWMKEPHSDGIGAGRTPRGQDVKALVLISPQTNYPGLPIAKELNDLRRPEWNLAVFVCSGKKDPLDKGQAHKTYDTLAPTPDSKQRVYIEEYPVTYHGTGLLGRKLKLEEQILVFFEKHLKGLSANWTDRRSRLDRK